MHEVSVRPVLYAPAAGLLQEEATFISPQKLRRLGFRHALVQTPHHVYNRVSAVPVEPNAEQVDGDNDCNTHPRESDQG